MAYDRERANRVGVGVRAGVAPDMRLWPTVAI